MFQVAFLVLGLVVIVLAIGFVFSKYQRTIFWVAALTLFIGTTLSLGLGLVKIVDNGVVNHIAAFTVILTFCTSGIFACHAERLHAAQQKKSSGQQVSPYINSENSTKSNAKGGLVEHNEHVELSAKLDTERARDVFSKAIEAGLMEENGHHYKWKGKKVQLAYMCGRIYCEDWPKYDEKEGKTYWRFGWTDFFPDSELNELFEETDLGQSRANRKDLAVPQGSNKIDKFFE